MGIGRGWDDKRTAATTMKANDKAKEELRDHVDDRCRLIDRYTGGKLTAVSDERQKQSKLAGVGWRWLGIDRRYGYGG